MELLLEFVLELLFEGVTFATKNKKIPLWIRFIIGFVLVVLFAGVITMILIVGVFVTRTSFVNKESVLGGVLLIALGVFLLAMTLYKVYRYHKNHHQKQDFL